MSDRDWQIKINGIEVNLRGIVDFEKFNRETAAELRIWQQLQKQRFAFEKAVEIKVDPQYL